MPATTTIAGSDSDPIGAGLFVCRWNSEFQWKNYMIE